MLENLPQEDKEKLILNQEALERVKQEQLQNQETSPEAIQKKIQEEIQKIEEYSEQIIDIPEYQEKQIASLGGNEQELADELANIDTEIKRTKSGFIERTKNYVIGLATMVASMGNVAAGTKQETKAKSETNVVYVEDKNDPRLKAYEDSLNLYSKYEDLFLYKKDAMKREIAKANKEAPFYQPKRKEVVINEPFKDSKTDTYTAYDRDSKIKPINLSFIKDVPVDNSLASIENITGSNFVTKESTKNMTPDALANRVIGRYKKPTLEVKLKQKTSETEKKTTVAPKTEEVKTNKVETKKDKVADIDNKNTPNDIESRFSVLKKTPINSLKDEKTIKELVDFKEEFSVETEKDKKQYELFLRDNKTNIETNDFKGTVFDEEARLEDLKDNIKIWQKENPKGYLVSMPYDDYVDFAKKRNNWDWDYEEYRNKISPTTVLVFMNGNKKNEQISQASFIYQFPKLYLKEKSSLKIPEIKKETIKNPEKTGYTVRVGEKLYYLSKEDLNKLESDKTTHYNVSEKGDGTEKHLVWWGGNEQGQNLQQVAERLGIKLPRAFDANRQEFDK